MKHIVAILLVLCIASCSNRITGIVHKQTGPHNGIYVKKDTLIKALQNENLSLEELDKLWKEQVAITDKNGRFRIKATSKDSLYFDTNGYHTLIYNVADLERMKDSVIQLSKIPCTEPVEYDLETVKIYIVIAQKIKLKSDRTKSCENQIKFDSKYNAQYKVLACPYGDYTKDTINFTVYDHNGIPYFSNFDTVLLYIADYNGELIHIRYQFSDLYQTSDGRWATPYDFYTYKKLNPDSPYKPKKIDFNTPVEFSFSEYDDETSQRYPSPYYDIKDRKATAIYGNYVEDIIAIKKETTLKEMGFILK